MPERHADGFARRSQEPERPDGQLELRRRDGGRLRDLHHEFLQRRGLVAGDDVGSAFGLGRFPCQPQPLVQVVHVHHLEVGRAVPQEPEPAARDAADQLVEPAVARPVDRAWPDHREGHPYSPRGLAGHLLTFELGLLVDVPRMQRGVLGGRMVARHVAMHPHGTAMDYAAHAGRGARLEQKTGRVDVDRAVLAVRHAGSAKHRREMVDQVHPGHRLVDHIFITDVAFQNFNACGAQLGGTGGPHQASDAVSAANQRPGQREAGKSAGAGDEYPGKRKLAGCPSAGPGSSCVHGVSAPA